MASADDKTAGVVLWNENTADRHVTLHLNALPFQGGRLEVYRIDGDHASFVDNPASEHLEVLERHSLRGRSASWSGTIPGESVVLLRAVALSPPHPRIQPAPGVCVRLLHWTPDRESGAYSDLDCGSIAGPVTVRMGTGRRQRGTTALGILIDHPSDQLTFQAVPHLARSLLQGHLAIWIDYGDPARGRMKSALLHGQGYDPSGKWPLPWGKPSLDLSLLQDHLDRGREFTVDLSRLAPNGWDRGQILLTFLLQDAPADTHLRIKISGSRAR